ncbi:MAG TPA: signal protein PDZ, partial [Opitutus sp.]|nr:signal protein PDZ [Opitutus sp.]
MTTIFYERLRVAAGLRACLPAKTPRASRQARRPAATLIGLAIFGAGFCGAADLPELWAERVKAVVAIEFYVETEIERRPSFAYGTVVDDRGTIIVPSVAVNARTTPSQLKDFKVYRAGEATSAAGEYLGQDALTGWHFIRVAESMRSALVPITTFAAAKPVEP